MSKKIEFVLHYRKGGEQCEKLLAVDFISNRVLREYSEMMAAITQVQSTWNAISDINTEIGSLKGDKNNKALIAIKKEEIRKLNEELLKNKDNVLLTKRFELIKRIFTDNGINDAEFLTFEFWDECVEPDETIIMLHTLINKDFEDKKKALKVAI